MPRPAVGGRPRRKRRRGSGADRSHRRPDAQAGQLPGIGPKTAERLTHHLLAAGVRSAGPGRRPPGRQGRNSACRQCCNLTEGDLCVLCAPAPRRLGAVRGRAAARPVRPGAIRDVPRTLPPVARPAGAPGRHRPEHLTIDKLLQRVRAGGVWEVIMATTPPWKAMVRWCTWPASWPRPGCASCAWHGDCLAGPGWNSLQPMLATHWRVGGRFDRGSFMARRRVHPADWSQTAGINPAARHGYGKRKRAPPRRRHSLDTGDDA